MVFGGGDPTKVVTAPSYLSFSTSPFFDRLAHSIGTVGGGCSLIVTMLIMTINRSRTKGLAATTATYTVVYHLPLLLVCNSSRMTKIP